MPGGRAIEVPGYPGRRDQQAEGEAHAAHQTGNGPCIGFFEDIGEFGYPFGLVNGFALAGAEAFGGEAENDVGQEVEPAPELVVHELGADSGCGATEEREGGPEQRGDTVPCWGRRRAGAGGRYCSLRAASCRRAAVTAAPVIV